jgi:hypothetical protein
MTKQYIGITDFSNLKEVQDTLRFFVLDRRSIDYWLHVGVMCSHKTINEQPSAWSQIWPDKSQLCRIFSISGTETHTPIMNCLHYADKPSDGHVRSHDELFRSLLKAVGYAGPYMDALQLDMVWPDPIAIDTLKRIHRHPFKVILQIDSMAFDMVDNNPTRLVERLCEYNGVIDYVLLDKSAGKGKGMDAEFLIPFLHQIRNDLPHLCLSVAGGLGPDTIEIARPIVEEFPSISIDAQGRLRPSGDASDPINWDMAEVYLLEAFRLFDECKR